MKPEVADALSHFVAWIRKGALPLWLERGLHVPGNWFSTRLTSSGQPVASEVVHLVSQAQMIYIISRAEHIGWLGGRHKLSRSLIDFAGRHGTLPCRSDGYVRTLQPSLNVLDSSHDPSDHAWFIIANTACFAAYGDALDLRRIHNILDWMNLCFADGVAWLGVDQHTLGPSDLHRLMLQAFLYLSEVTHKPIWRKRTEDLLHFCSAHFFSPAVSGNSNMLGNTGLAERFAWVRTLCRYERHIHSGLMFAPFYQLATIESARIAGGMKEVNCLLLAEAIGADLVLFESGMASADAVLPCLQRFFDEYVSRDIWGMFADDPRSPDTSGSVATLVSLFEASIIANRLLSQK